MRYFKKCLPVALLLCASCSMFQAQRDDTPEEVLRVSELEKSSYEEQLPCYQGGLPLSGTVERYYDGSLFLVGDVYTDSKRDELRAFYKPEGILAVQSTCQHGVLQGVTKTFYPNGNLKTEGTYQNGALNGNSFEYFESGALRSQTTYQNGLKEGLHILYNEERNVQGMVYFSGNEPVSGVCIMSSGNKINLTNAELHNYVKGAGISCK